MNRVRRPMSATITGSENAYMCNRIKNAVKIFKKNLFRIQIHHKLQYKIGPKPTIGAVFNYLKEPRTSKMCG